MFFILKIKLLSVNIKLSTEFIIIKGKNFKKCKDKVKKYLQTKESWYIIREDNDKILLYELHKNSQGTKEIGTLKNEKIIIL